MLEEYVSDASLTTMPVYDKRTQIGFWRLAQVRTHSTGEIMLILQITPNDVAPETVKLEKEKMRDYLVSKCTEESIQLTSLFFQENTGVFTGITDKFPMEIFHGEGHVHENLLGLKFRISPTAFFQVNTPATEILYSSIRDWASLSENAKEDTLLLDLCCGTGIYFILLMSLD